MRAFDRLKRVAVVSLLPAMTVLVFACDGNDSQASIDIVALCLTTEAPSARERDVMAIAKTRTFELDHHSGTVIQIDISTAEGNGGAPPSASPRLVSNPPQETSGRMVKGLVMWQHSYSGSNLLVTAFPETVDAHAEVEASILDLTQRLDECLGNN